MSSGRGKGSRRLTFAAVSGVIVLAATACAVLAVVVAERRGVRVDVTATGEHRLSPRTEKLLDSLSEPYRVVVAADSRTIDPRAMDRVRRTIGLLERRSVNVKSVILDTASPDGLVRYQQLLAELTRRDASAIGQQVGTLRETAAALRSAAATLRERTAPALESLRGAFPAASGERAGGITEAVGQRLATAQRLAEMAEAAAGGAKLAWSPDSGRPPKITGPRRAMREALDGLVSQCKVLAGELESLRGAEGMTAAQGALAAEAGRSAEGVRESAAAARDRLLRLPPLDIVRLAEAIEAQTAVVIVGPSGLSAIDPGSMFPAGELLDAGGAPLADMRRRTEDLLASAISSLRTPVRPIVVLAHGEAREFLDRVPLFTRARERLALRGVDVVEWATAVNAAAPDLTALDPRRERPIVHVVFSPAGWTAGGEDGSEPGAARAAKLAGAMDAIIAGGGNVLLNLNPSPLPGYGQADPLAALVTGFGLSADTARPILRERVTARGRIAETDARVTSGTSESPIASAVGNLPTLLPWPIAVRRAAGADESGASWVPLYTLGPDDGLWAESRWLRLRQTRRDDRPLLPEQPVFDADTDERAGPWTIAGAAERRFGDGGTQRLVVVGSNDWFVDNVIGAETVIDGRVVPENPGNLEFLEAAVLWLAGQDALIARSPSAQSVALVAPMTSGRLLTLRLLLIAGVPLLVLVGGVLYRVVRG